MEERSKISLVVQLAMQIPRAGTVECLTIHRGTVLSLPWDHEKLCRRKDWLGCKAIGVGKGQGSYQVVRRPTEVEGALSHAALI